MAPKYETILKAAAIIEGRLSATNQKYQKEEI